MKTWVRSKRYVIYEVSEDGLLKHPKQSCGEEAFSAYGYETEDAAWAAIEAEAGDPNTPYVWRRTWTVLAEWRIEAQGPRHD